MDPGGACVEVGVSRSRTRPKTSGRKRRRSSGHDEWSEDAAPVARAVGHRWTSVETRAIALGIGGRARARHYPDLLRAWAQRAARIRWNVVRAAQGRTLLPVPDVPDVQTPGAAKMRQRRAQAR